ncbi:hypothetical protein [Lysobacter enzymogenes]|uniref:hypothetical protein n=1 Tax=Lysobacter enzymogenes TaxID=69 RepID=UPI00110FD1B0|nr:hypothetical protein [Lysobacter enzymogenes]QCW28055.1 hypothetical protein FE772_22835 [Lysobacter enzymogenes]QQQ01965.1 hypothetical protein JHW41_02940 [Lysobacter enzymogenes]
MSRVSIEALLAISNPSVIPRSKLDGLIRQMPVVEAADSSWGLTLEDPCEYTDTDSCLEANLERIGVLGEFASQAGLTLRIAVYNESATYTGRIKPRQEVVDAGLLIELSVYPTA